MKKCKTWLTDLTADTAEFRTPNSEFPIQIAWLSLDEEDNDPARFLSYVIAALQTVIPDIQSGSKRRVMGQFTG